MAIRSLIYIRRKYNETYDILYVVQSSLLIVKQLLATRIELKSESFDKRKIVMLLAAHS